MELSKVKKYRKRHRLINTLFTRNPVAAIGLDLPFLIATSFSVRAAAAISLELLIVHMGAMVAALLTRRLFRGIWRPMVNILVSTLLMMAARALLVMLFRGITDSLGMYMYLMAVNGLTIYQTSTLPKRARALPTLRQALLNVFGFTLAIFGLSLFRELFGNGTIWGYPVGVPLRLGGMLVPFFGFILVGFLMALVRFVNKQILAIALRERERREARFMVISD